MSRPDPLAPPGRIAEPWQLETLALANALIEAGRLTPGDWAEALGAALAQAAANGAPDTEDTYYRAALTALERLACARTPLTESALAARKAAWKDAYRATPHGQPVTLR